MDKKEEEERQKKVQELLDGVFNEPFLRKQVKSLANE